MTSYDDMISYIYMIWYYMIWYYMIWYDMILYDMPIFTPKKWHRDVWLSIHADLKFEWMNDMVFFIWFIESYGDLTLLTWTTPPTFLGFVLHLHAWWSKSPTKYPCVILQPSCCNIFSLASSMMKLWWNQSQSFTIDLQSNPHISAFFRHFIWANYNNSLIWIKAIWGWFPLLTMISSELVVSSL